MDREIVTRLMKRIGDAGLDAIIAVSPENVSYVTGFVVPSQSLMRWRHAICVVTADGRISMVVVDMEANTVKTHASIDDLRVYREFTEDPMNKLAEALKDLKLDRARIGIEMEFLPAKDFATLQKNLPAVQWIASDAIFNKARQVKTPKELELLRSLSKLTDKAIGDTLRQAKVGNERNGSRGFAAQGAVRRWSGKLQTDDYRIRGAKPISQRRAHGAKTAVG